MNSNSTFRPDWTSTPGDTIADILRERQLSLVEFAKLMGQTTQEITNLLQGRAMVTIAIARRLASVLGASIEFWMSRDFQYREDLARIQATEEEWLSEVPLRDMVSFGWLTPAPNPSDEVTACLRFFNVPSIMAWREAYGEVQEAVAFRTSPSFDSWPTAVAAWLRQGEIVGETIKCNTWDASHFKETLTRIRPLTRNKDPHIFLPRLQSYCAESGVALAVVRAPRGCHASGATRFLSAEKALLLLSFRHLTDDHFWFTFFHEAGHLLLHGDKKLFIEGEDTPSTAEEHEANEFAEQILIPTEFRKEFARLRPSTSDIIKFARRAGVSPGIVVGQLQHLGRIKYNWLNGLKRYFSWDE